MESIRYVNLVTPVMNWGQKRSDIKEYHIDPFVIGDDWAGKFDDLRDICYVVYMERTPEISTIQINEQLKGKTNHG